MKVRVSKEEWKAWAAACLAPMGAGYVVAPFVKEELSAGADAITHVALGILFLLTAPWLRHLPWAFLRLRWRIALGGDAQPRLLCGLGWHRDSVWGRTIYFRYYGRWKGEGPRPILYLVGREPRDEACGKVTSFSGRPWSCRACGRDAVEGRRELRRQRHSPPDIWEPDNRYV